jgi:hypothetical protein
MAEIDVRRRVTTVQHMARVDELERQEEARSAKSRGGVLEVPWSEFDPDGQTIFAKQEKLEQERIDQEARLTADEMRKALSSDPA